MILGISRLSIATSLFSFLILLIWDFVFWSVWLMVCQFWLSSQGTAFTFINLCYCFLHFFFTYFCSELYDFFPSTNFGAFCSFFSSCFRCAVLSCSVVSNSLQPHGRNPPGSSVHGHSPGRNTGVGWHVLLQGIFATQWLNPSLPHWQQILYQLSLGCSFDVFLASWVRLLLE